MGKISKRYVRNLSLAGILILAILLAAPPYQAHATDYPDSITYHGCVFTTLPPEMSPSGCQIRGVMSWSCPPQDPLFDVSISSIEVGLGRRAADAPWTDDDYIPPSFATNIITPSAMEETSGLAYGNYAGVAPGECFRSEATDNDPPAHEFGIVSADTCITDSRPRSACGGDTVAANTFSRGDAEALFQASLSGGGAIVIHGNTSLQSHSNPFDPVRQVQEPFEWFDGNHLCEDDYLVFQYTWLDCPGPFPCSAPTIAGMKSMLSQIQVSFQIDGQELEVQQTAPRRVNPDAVPLFDFLPFGGTWFYKIIGSIQPPGAVGVGPHVVSQQTKYFFLDSEGVMQSDEFETQSFFIVDQSGTGRCLLYY